MIYFKWESMDFYLFNMLSIFLISQFISNLFFYQILFKYIYTENP